MNPSYGNYFFQELKLRSDFTQLTKTITDLMTEVLEEDDTT